ncbi:MAG: 30S ribosome-binding factor RbfA [Desulfobacterales bacterium]|nr:30S ribosome-binding factor RbfA [Desulfobacterales bacterium]MDD3081398.1 30S ribosome-binding factor RbfA [Desulfobacterales bacterium]MDD3950007.1 30S ribosome-binding factor RbfA [Desulfobacterales bacterium]MDY0376901.1 30S ribosome-binding factor RbfA [Desulfobacterales bacterium]
MRHFSRSDRVAGLIQRLLSVLLAKGIKDPRLEMAVITSVDMSDDLRNARIYFIPSGGRRNRVDAEKGFKAARGYIKRTLARELGLRYMPELEFCFDESFDYGSRIEQILQSIDTADGSDHQTPEK